MRGHIRSGFDKLAAPYRFLEFLTFGPLLMRSRLAFLAEMKQCRHALVLGDGDGRFCEALLRANANTHVTAIDNSPAMLRQLESRATLVGARTRLTTHLQDVRNELPPGCFDLVCSHFLLDCLDDAEVRNLVASVRRRIGDGCWVVSEFAIPAGMPRWPAMLLVKSLYLAFGVLTGLRVRRLPRHADVLREARLRCVAVRTRLFGILRSELWAAGENCGGK